jgi:hypothetical protein
MRKLSLIGLIVVVAIIGGCGGNGSGEAPMGTVEINVVLPSELNTEAVARSISEVEFVRVTITAPDIQPIIREVQIDPATHTGSDRIAVRAGSNRHFKAEALDSDNNVIYQGEATVNIPPGVVTRVNITLRVVSGDVHLEVIVHEGMPDLQFTYVPPIGSHDDLKGIVTGGINPDQLAVAVYIKVGSGWWTKPYWDSPKTLPRSDGTWVCDITTGGSDSAATEVAAYLIWRTADPPLAYGGPLPVIDDALDFESVVR